MRRRATVAALGLLAAGVLAGPAVTSAVAVPVPEDCKIQPGGSSVDPWAQQRVGVQQAWTVTRGRDVDTGAPIRVAVIDSGLSLRHPQLAGVQHAAARTAIAHDPLRGITDCGGHGTQVTAIIAAQPRPGAAFYGVAPDVEVLPIKVSNGKTGSLAAVVTAIDLAIAEHAQVVNMSLGVKSDAPALRAAVQRAAEHRVLIVAAAGNDQQQDNLPQYPAAYSTRFDNVIAVSATDRRIRWATSPRPATTSTSRPRACRCRRSGRSAGTGASRARASPRRSSPAPPPWCWPRIPGSTPAQHPRPHRGDRRPAAGQRARPALRLGHRRPVPRRHVGQRPARRRARRPRPGRCRPGPHRVRPTAACSTPRWPWARSCSG